MIERTTGWPVESAARSARPVAVVNVDGRGYEPSPVPAAGLADESLSCSACRSRYSGQRHESRVDGRGSTGWPRRQASLFVLHTDCR